MSDQDKMRALAKRLREPYRVTEIAALTQPLHTEASDAIDLLMAEVEALLHDNEELVKAANYEATLAEQLRAELEAAAADKRDTLTRLLTIIEKDSEWADARFVDWTRGILMATLKIALAQRQGEGS